MKHHLARFVSGAAVAVVVVASMTACALGPSEGKTMEPTPTAQHQRDVAVAYATRTMEVSGLQWTESASEEWAQDCELDSGRGALFNFTRTAEGTPDPEPVAKRVGAAWKADGLTVEYSRETMSSGAAQYVVNGSGGDVERIQFGVATTKSSLLGASHCGTGDASELG